MFKRLFNLKSNKGVTLVALIITIIVLLILAGVTINVVVGGEGTVEKASEAKNATENSNNKAIVENAVAIAMGKEKGTTLHLDTLTNAVGNVGTVAQEGQYFTVTIQNYKYWVTPEGEVSVEIPLKIGDTMSYSTLLNGVTLNNWKVFYKEIKDGTSYTWLILDDYLQYNAIGNITGLAKGNPGTNTDYCVRSTVSRKNLIDAMITTSNWNSLLTGTLNGTSIDYRSSTDINIKAMGSPTLDLYVNSWNEKYPSTPIYTAQTASAMGDGYYGYYVSKINNPPKTSEYNLTMVTAPGYSDTLYYPHTSNYESCFGYWLASPSAVMNGGMMLVGYYGGVANDSYGSAGQAFRPVICLPSSAFE